MSPTQCNIDARGKAVRLIWGVLMLLTAGTLLALLLFDVVTGWPWWLAAIATLLFGALGIYSGWRGWCAVRALGIRTWV